MTRKSLARASCRCELLVPGSLRHPAKVHQTIHQDAQSLAPYSGEAPNTFFYWLKVARLGRLERPTSCFGGTRSIQLSYSRTLPLYHAAAHGAFSDLFFLPRSASMSIQEFDSRQNFRPSEEGSPLSKSNMIVLESAQKVSTRSHSKKGIAVHGARCIYQLRVGRQARGGCRLRHT